jgi:hypothetical protein
MPFIQRPRNIDEKLSAMKIAKEVADKVIEEKKILAFSLETYNKLCTFLPMFEKEVEEVKAVLNNQTETMWLKQKNLSLLRINITHFIKVFNFAVEREVFHASERAFYGLDVNSESVPFMKGEADTVMWVKMLINGERKRKEKGLLPMTNPKIEEIETVFTKYQKLEKESSKLQHDYSLSLNDISILVNEADEMIKDIWDEVEFFYRKESLESRINMTRKYGLVYIQESDNTRED